jgi:signal transduction histidine kinase
MSYVEPLANFLRTQSRTWLFIEALALAVIVGIIDYLTGYEVTIWPFYSIPILLMVWYGDMKLAVLISVLSTFAWWFVDKASGHLYSSEWLRVWDGIVRLIFFCVVMFAGWTFGQQRAAIRARLELLEKSQQLEEEIISISEREQQRIGRDLHDGVCQYLAAIGYSASILKQELEREAHILSKTAGEIANLLQNAAVLTRNLARGLSPVDRDEGGLESALEELASSTSRIAGISCSFVCPEPVMVRDNTQAVHLFRIAQEALSNALKHGHAKSAVIALESADEACSLRISDDGIGFVPANGERNGMGLSIMRYRARVIAGQLEIQANSPTGTVVVCTIGKSVAARQNIEFKSSRATKGLEL